MRFINNFEFEELSTYTNNIKIGIINRTSYIIYHDSEIYEFYTKPKNVYMGEFYCGNNEYFFICGFKNYVSFPIKAFDLINKKIIVDRETLNLIYDMYKNPYKKALKLKP